MYFATDLTWNQFFVFVYTMFGGMLIGALYCFHEGKKRIFRKKPYAVYLDVVFCFEAFVIMAFILYSVNRGVIKLHAICGFITGYFIFYKTFLNSITNSMEKFGLKVRYLVSKLRKHKK